ncbi:hypothetical protein NDU88_001302 [Pleurodeles waltl]|uniref:Uncharacterized protein n=1 Tax=Pleurodeles waltl TaxID=8319 RepID=A0AAV7LYZ8_PLEWA|nr:hypothetical protein NDU88_001302 [Pleurodeles waltl]
MCCGPFTATHPQCPRGTEDSAWLHPEAPAERTNKERLQEHSGLHSMHGDAFWRPGAAEEDKEDRRDPFLARTTPVEAATSPKETIPAGSPQPQDRRTRRRRQHQPGHALGRVWPSQKILQYLKKRSAIKEGIGTEKRVQFSRKEKRARTITKEIEKEEEGEKCCEIAEASYKQEHQVQ